MSDELYELGHKVREEVMGQSRRDYDQLADEEFEGRFHRMATEFGWGGIWGDDALTRKQHSLNCLCILGALGRLNQFKSHMRGAIRNGCTREELRATLHQIAGYAGLPAGVEAFRIAREVFAEQGQS